MTNRDPNTQVFLSLDDPQHTIFKKVWADRERILGRALTADEFLKGIFGWFLGTLGMPNSLFAMAPAKAGRRKKTIPY